jgi:hypothetical protein
MAAKQKSGQGLEIERDPAFQRREWALQRVAWGLMSAVVVAALFGLFGEGPVARAEAVSEGGSLRIRYDRIVRAQTTTTLLVSISGPALRADTARIWLDRAFVHDMPVQQITPDPERVSIDATRLHYTFVVHPGTDSAAVNIELQPVSLGSKRAAIGLGAGEAVVFRQYVLP